MLFRKPIVNICFSFLCSFIATNAYSAELHVSVSDEQGEALENAIVEVILPEQLKTQFDGNQGVLVDQIDKEFVPTVSIVVQGSRVSFPNSDDILHHVYSFSSAKTFNIPLYGKGESEALDESFLEAGVVEIGCNIHDWMLAYLYVAESTMVAVSNADGVAAIDGLPEGDYRVKVWHPRLPVNAEEQIISASLSDGSVSRVSTSLQLERDRRLRRAPSANRQRYR